MTKAHLQRALSKPTQHAAEARAIYIATGSFILGLIIALIAFWPNAQHLFGGKSIGLVASIVATSCAFIAFFIGNIGQYPLDPKLTLPVRVRNGFTKTALAFTHAAIVFLLTTAGYFIFSDAFKGLWLDPVISSFIVASTVSIATYIVYLAAIEITTVQVSTALAIFMASGVITSMITTENPYWWELHFSSLGADGTKSSMAFNLTLIIAGLVAVALSDFIARDFRLLKQGSERYQKDRATIIRVAIALMGLFLAFVGIFIYNIHPVMHVGSAAGMAFIFMGIAAFSPLLMSSFSKAFIGMTYGFLAALVVSMWLYVGVGYFTLTAFELIAFIVIFTWLVVFIRQIAANVATLPRPKTQRVPKGKLV